jgi:hypothetical protein
MHSRIPLYILNPINTTLFTNSALINKCLTGVSIKCYERINRKCFSSLVNTNHLNLTNTNTATNTLLSSNPNINNISIESLGNNRLLSLYDRNNSMSLVCRIYSFWFRSMNLTENPQNIKNHYNQDLKPINYDCLNLWFSSYLELDKLIK